MLKKLVIDTDKKILFLRLLLATLVLLDLLYAKLYFPESDSSFDLFQLRFVISLLLIANFTITFFIDRKGLLLVLFTSVALVINTLFELYLLYEHSFHYVNVSEFLFTALISSLIFPRARMALAYMIAVVVAFVVINCLLKFPILDIITHSILIGLYAFVVLCFSALKLHFERRFRQRGDLSHYLFQDSLESMVLANKKSLEIQLLNPKTRQIFSVSPEQDLTKTKFTDFFSSKGIHLDIAEIETEVRESGQFFRETSFMLPNGEKFSGNFYVKSFESEDFPRWLIRISDLSDQHKSHDRLQTNWETFSRMLDTIPHTICLKDPESRFLLVNKMFEEMHGKTRDFLIGKTDYDLFSHEKADFFHEQEQNVMKSGKAIHLPEEKMQMPNGTEKVLQITKLPFYLPEQKKNGLLGLGIDATEIVKYQEKLRKSEANYRMLMEQASDGIYSADKYGIMTDANPKTCQMLGYTKGELVGLNVRSLTDNKDENPISQQLAQIKDKKSVILEKKFRRKDGDIFIVELSVTILEDGGHQGIMRDITERKRLEKILQDNEKKFRALIESSYDITAILDEKLKVTFISPSILKILGYMPKKMEGLTPFDLIHSEDRMITEKFLKEILATPKQFNILPELRIRAFSGQYRHFEVAGTNLMSDPTINGIVINLHDISERKNTEIQLLNANFELDSFVYRVSHDIKAPLRSVMGLLSIAKLENKQPVMNTYLEMMNKSVLNLDHFIKDLTLFSRNSRMELEFKKVDFEKVVNECIENLKFMENVEKVEIRKNIKPNLFFFSDLTRITTIISNLLSNSLKYHKFEPGKSYVGITITDENKHIVIKVEDNGVGINSEYLDKIFDMFFRASEKSYGSGLGLYIVKTAVKKLKGDIEVQSELNEGTTFKVILPRLTVTNNNG
jgi:PAS domain S-box-containing protein